MLALYLAVERCLGFIKGLFLVHSNHNRLALGVGGEILGFVRREIIFLVIGLDNFVGGIAGTTVLHPEEDDRLANKHADSAGGDTDRHTNHDWEDDEGENVLGESHDGTQHSRMVSLTIVVLRVELARAENVVRRQLGGFAIAGRLGRRWVTGQTMEAVHTEALHFMSSVTCFVDRFVGRLSGFGAGVSHGGGQFNHCSACHVCAFGVRVIW